MVGTTVKIATNKKREETPNTSLSMGTGTEVYNAEVQTKKRK